MELNISYWSLDISNISITTTAIREGSKVDKNSRQFFERILFVTTTTIVHKRMTLHKAILLIGKLYWSQQSKVQIIFNTGNSYNLAFIEKRNFQAILLYNPINFYMWEWMKYFTNLFRIWQCKRENWIT